MITTAVPEYSIKLVDAQFAGLSESSLLQVQSQTRFLNQIEQQASERGSVCAVDFYTCEGLQGSLFPQLKSVLNVVLSSEKPSIFLDIMQQSGVLKTFPELNLLTQMPQDPIWHPEGNAWVHTMLVVDRAKLLLRELPIQLSSAEESGVLWGVLLHDIGKASTTQSRIVDRRIVSPHHEKEGVAPARKILDQLGVETEVAQVALAIVERHMTPPMLYRELVNGKLDNQSYERALTRLTHRIDPVRLEPLMIAAMADRLGRETSQSDADKIAFAVPMAEKLKVSLGEIM